MSYPRYLTRARAILNKTTLNTTATLMRKSHVADTTGGFVDSYAVAGTYPCSFSPYQITPIERESTTVVQTITVWTFVFPYGTVVLATDRIICQGRTFEVTSSAIGSLSVAERVLATEIT